MHTLATPSEVTKEHKILLQVEAYLVYNLSITTSLVENTCTRLNAIETQLATPVAAVGKTRKSLRNSRARLVKQMSACRTEAEMLARALDEVRTKITGVRMLLGSERGRLSVLQQPNVGIGRSARSPMDGMSERSGSIRSYISSAELSSGPPQTSGYTPDGSVMISPIVPGPQLPYIHTSIPIEASTQNLSSAPLYAPSPYIVSPCTYGPYSAIQPTYPEPWIGISPCTTNSVWYAHPNHCQTADFQTTVLDTPLAPVPESMPVDATTWSFQQSPVGDTFTNVAQETPKTTEIRRRYSDGPSLSSEPATAAAATKRKRRHGRGLSCDVARLIKERNEKAALSTI